MTYLPTYPDRKLLAEFAEANTQTDVGKLTGKRHDYIYKHIRRARELGLIEEMPDRRPSKRFGPLMKLFRLTEKGQLYVKAVDW